MSHKCPSNINRSNKENDDVYLFYFETLQLEIVKAFFYFIKPADYTYCTYFITFRRLK